MKRFFVVSVSFLSLLLASCDNLILGPDPDNTPIDNFNILWREFDLNYPSFIVKNINWDSVYSVYHDSVTSHLSDDRLWNILCKTISCFNDPHVYIYNRDHTRYFNSSKPANYNFHEFSLDLVKVRYLRGNYKTAGEGNFTYGTFPGDSVGYIYISTFDENIIRSHDIDVIVKNLYNASSIIIDVRDNRGGFFNNLEYIASAFINSPVTYLMEKSRNGPGHNDFTSPLYYNIRPRPYAQQYTKQIVLLTNRSTASAAEIFAVALKQLKYSVQIGDSTAGGLGISNRTFLLPNGWTYHMPQSLNLSVDGHSFEGIGVLPDIYVRNSRLEIEAGYDRILDYAIQYVLR